MTSPVERLALYDRYRIERESSLFFKNRDRKALPRTCLTTSIDQLYRAKVGR